MFSGETLCQKSTLEIPKYFSQNLVTFKIKNLTTFQDLGKVAPQQGWGMEVNSRIRVVDTKFVRYGQVR